MRRRHLLFAAAMLTACPDEDALQHESGQGVAYSGGTPGAPCPGDLVPEAGWCIDYGDNGHARCESNADCSPNYVCRAFDAGACACDPRPGAWETCAPRCTADIDCQASRSAEPVDWGYVCDIERGVCRAPSSCLVAADCTAPEVCTDGDWFFWYVGGDGQLYDGDAPQRCAMPGDLPIGAACRWGTECATGSCGGDLYDSRCQQPCRTNAECGELQCAQGEWGAPSCTADRPCRGVGTPEQFCRDGQWVTPCTTSGECSDSDCTFPDTQPGAYGFGGLGFGVGDCTAAALCEADEFHSAWADAWTEPTCFVATACWDDTDCDAPYRCLPLDATASTRRCGRSAS